MAPLPQSGGGTAWEGSDACEGSLARPPSRNAWPEGVFQPIGGVTTLGPSPEFPTCEKSRAPAENCHEPGRKGAHDSLVRRSGTLLRRLCAQMGMGSYTDKAPKRRIEKTRGIDRGYVLSKKLRVVDTPGAELLRGTHVSSGRNVLVKVRRKFVKGGSNCSFASEDDEAAWRHCMEMVLNWPRCSSVAHVYEVLEDSKAYYCVMEKAPGLDLFDTLKRQGQLSEPDIKEVIRELLIALQTLHNHGCIHRDLKLENVVARRQPPPCPNGHGEILLEQRQRSWPSAPLTVKLVDFDEAQAYPAPKVQKGRRQVEAVVGTNQYIAPEAYAGHYSPASDIFAVGVILFRLLMGMFPFSGRLFDDAPGENVVGHPKMEAILQKLTSATIAWDVPARGREAPGLQALNLCRQMIAMDCSQRPTAQMALAHPWLATTAVPADPEAAWLLTPEVPLRVAAQAETLLEPHGAEIEEAEAPLKPPEAEYEESIAKIERWGNAVLKHNRSGIDEAVASITTASSRSSKQAVEVVSLEDPVGFLPGCVQ